VESYARSNVNSVLSAPGFILSTLLSSPVPRITIPLLEEALLRKPQPKAQPPKSTVATGLRWDLSASEGRKQAASAYRATPQFKERRAEKRRLERSITGREKRSQAACKVSTEAVQISAASSGTGYTGSLTKKVRELIAELWQPEAQTRAMLSLLPVPYKLSKIAF
jgi:hypothetical protein